jgi:superfamily II DNA or RNA helicase
MVEFFKEHHYALNGSEPGTGKTFGSIAFGADKKRITVVAPAFLLKNWQREFARFGRDAAIFPELGPVTLISQDQIHKSATPFLNLDLLIVDECHSMNNLESRRSKALHTYVKSHSPKCLHLLSGTPSKGKVCELYSLLLLVDYGNGGIFKKRFSNQFTFNMTFSNPVVKHFGKRKVTSFEGSRNTAVLNSWIKQHFIRFKTSDVTDFPEVFFTEFESEDLPEDVLWVDSALEGWESMAQFDSPPPLHISSAKKDAAITKIPTTTELAKSLLDGGEECLVVFSDHKIPAFDISEALKEYGSALITGEVSMPDRDRIVQDFQSGKLRVIVGTLGSMSVGLTLTRAKTVILNDRNWTPAINHQAVGRLRRISQKHTVRVIDVVRDGVDKRIARKLKEKEKVLKETIDG